MPRKESKVITEKNGPVPQQEELGSGQSTLADVYRPSQETFRTTGEKVEQIHG